MDEELKNDEVHLFYEEISSGKESHFICKSSDEDGSILKRILINPGNEADKYQFVICGQHLLFRE